LRAGTIAVVASQIAAIGYIDFCIFETSGKLCPQQTCHRFLSPDELIEIQNQPSESDVSMHIGLTLLLRRPAEQESFCVSTGSRAFDKF
jgi:hypothetical protein